MGFLDTSPTYQEALATRKKKYDKNIKSWKSIFLNCCSPTIPWIDRLGYEYMNYFNCNIESRNYSINIKICIILFYFILISYSCSRADIFSNAFLGEKICSITFPVSKTWCILFLCRSTWPTCLNRFAHRSQLYRRSFNSQEYIYIFLWRI